MIYGDEFNTHPHYKLKDGQIGFPYGNNPYTTAWHKSDTLHVTGKIIRIFTTYNTSFILTDEGKLYACGDRSYGASGLASESGALLHRWTLLSNISHEFVTGQFLFECES